MTGAEPRFFDSGAAFREWLEANHTQARELTVGFFKRGAARIGMTYPEALDEALCFGWIDGVRKSIDDAGYSIRFSPRKPKSIWSEVNIRRAEELSALGRMHPAGLRAFHGRDPERTGLYSFERSQAAFDAALEGRFRANPEAWTFFEKQPAGYRRTSTWWVMSAKKEETRRRRLGVLIAESQQGRRVPLVTGAAKPA